MQAPNSYFNKQTVLSAVYVKGPQHNSRHLQIGSHKDVTYPHN